MNDDILRVTALIEEYYRTNCANKVLYAEIEAFASQNTIPLCSHLLDLQASISLNTRYHGVLILIMAPETNWSFLLTALSTYSQYYLESEQSVFPLVNKMVECVVKTCITNKDDDIIRLIVGCVQGTQVDVMDFLGMSPAQNRYVLMVVKIMLEEMMVMNKDEGVVMLNNNQVFQIIEYNLGMLISTPSGDYNSVTDLLFDIVTYLIPYDNALIKMLLKVMTMDEVTYKYADDVINVFYNVMDDGKKLDYDSRYMIELYFNPETVLSNHNKIDTSFIDNTFIVKYIQHIINNVLLDDLSKLSLFYNVLLENSNEVLLNKILIGEDVATNLEFMLSLMDLPLKPIAEEQFSLNLLTLWSDIVDNLITNNNIHYNHTLNKLILVLFKKLSLANYDNDVEFLGFRDDATDLIKSMWSLLGNGFVYDLLNELLFMDYKADYYAFENYINILNNVMSFDDQIMDLLRRDNYGVIKKVMESIKVVCQDENSLGIIVMKTLTTFVNKISEFLNQNVDILTSVVNALLELIFNHKVSLQVERVMLLLLSDLVTSNCDKLKSFISTFEMILSDVMKSQNFYSSNVIIAVNKLYGCLVSSVDIGDNTVIDDDICIELGNNILANANKYLVLISGLLNDTNTNLILKCIKSFLVGLDTISKDDSTEGLDPTTSMLLKTKEYVKNASTTSALLLTFLTNSFALSKDTDLATLQSWFDILVFIITKDTFNINLENMLQILTTKLYPDLIENTKIFDKVLTIFQELVNNNYINTLFDFKITYYTLIVNNQYSRNNFNNIINKDMDLLESYYNILISVATDHSSSLIPNNTEYNTDDDVSALILIQTVKDYQKHNEKFILVAITKFLIKLFNNKKFTSYQTQLINGIFISDGNFLSYSNIIKISFMNILELNGDFDYITELVRNMISVHKMMSKKWLVMVINDNAFVDQCLMLNSNLTFVNNANNMMVKKIQVCNGNRKIIKVVNDWYRGLISK